MEERKVNWKQYTEIYTGLLKSRDIIKNMALQTLMEPVSSVVKKPLNSATEDSW